MFWMKACPKCHGDLYLDSDVHGTYIACLQCGHYLPQAEPTRQGSHTPKFEAQPTAVVYRHYSTA